MLGALTDTSGLKNRKDMIKKIEIFHINLRKAINACKKLAENLVNIKNAIISVNENRINVGRIETFNAPLYTKTKDRITRAAVYIKGNLYRGTLIAQLSTPDVAVVDVVGNGVNFIVISAYLPPNEDYKRALNELQFAINNINDEKKILICSDTNSRSTFWSDKITNDRGKLFEEFVITNDLMLMNTKHPITFFNTKNETSKIDLIVGNHKILDYQPFVEVMTNTYTASDHKMIKIELEIGHLRSDNPLRSTTRIYRTNKANWDLFDMNLDSYIHIIEHTNFEIENKEEADSAVKKLNQYLETVCETAIPKLKHSSTRKPDQNDEIDRLTKLENNLATRYERLKNTNKFEALKVLKELTEAQRQMTNALIKQRKACWEDECTTKDINQAYNIHRKCKMGLNRSCPSTIKDVNGVATKNSHETTEKLFEHSFPDKKHPKLQEQMPTNNACDYNEITSKEVSQIILWMANDKSPGVDGFTPQIIKRALPKILIPITALFNSLLRIQYFPDSWKEGFAIFIPKPNTDNKMKTVKDFRPITLLNVLAKVFEKLVITRINKYLYSNAKINCRQDGFSKQRSTIHSLHSFRNFIMKNAKRNCSTVAVFLDISGAFDNACWQLIIESLKRKDCPIYLTNLIISYFQNRKVTTNSHNTKLEKELNQGCPQGSCCGPSLWNILLNNIFDIDKIKEKLNCEDFYIKAFADDLALAFAIDNNLHSVEKFENMVEVTLNAIHKWGTEHFLDFNVKKTKAILFKSSAYVKIPKIKMNKQHIQFEKSAKYLGIWFDDNLSFVEHAQKTLDKCKIIFNITRSYCGKTWGLDPYLTRLIYKTIILPVLTYGASIWYPAFINKNISNKIRTFHYNCSKNIIKSYRTISIVASRLLSYTLPLESEIYMRAQIELSRITGAISPDILNNKLFNNESYKPQYFHSTLLDIFDKENDIITIDNTENICFGDIEELRIEPRVKWANLPVGNDKIEIEITEDYLETKSDYYIFTDGSHRQNYGTGCGVVIKNDNNENIFVNNIPMHPLCSTFQAEMFGIYHSLKWSCSNLELNDKRIMVCTDSLGAIKLMKNNFSDKLLPFLINDCLLKLESSNCKVSFAKIPAHADIEGNELADQQAKEASSKSMNHKSKTTTPKSVNITTAIADNTDPEYNYLPISCIKQSIKKQCINAWFGSAYDKEFQDDRAKLNDWIKNFIPEEKYITKKLIDLCDYYTTQVVTSHGSFMNYFKRFELSENDKCLSCKDQKDDPEHALFKCSDKYKTVLENMEIREPKDLYKVLNSTENIKTFKELCKTMVTERNELINKHGKMNRKQEGKLADKNNLKTNSGSSMKAEAKVKLKRNNTIIKGSNDKLPIPTDRKNSLGRDEWLNDEQILKFAQKIQTKLDRKNYVILPALIYGNNNQLASFLNYNITNDKEYILVIINSNGNHWILGLINLKTKTIAILDSYYKDMNHICDYKRLYMIARLALIYRNEVHSFEDFKFINSLDNPRQENENDCGVFTCRYTRNILEKKCRKFTIKTGEYRNIIVGVLNNNLSIPTERGPRVHRTIINETIGDERFIEEIEHLEIEIIATNYEQLIRCFYQ